MSAFDGAGSTAIGALAGLAGSVLGGNAAQKAARDQRGFQRQTDRKNITNQLALLRALLEGSSTAGAGGFAPDIAAQRAILDNPNSTIEQKKTAQKTLLRLEDRQRQTGDIGLNTAGLPGLRTEIDSETARLLSEFDRVFGPGGSVRSGLSSTLGGTRQFSDALLANADQFGPAAIAAANSGVDRQVGEALAAVNRSAGQRGLRRGPGGSSFQDAAEVSTRGNAAGGLAQALANIESQRASLRGSALSQRLDLERAIAGQLSGFDTGAAGNRFGLFQNASNQRLGTFQQGLDAIGRLNSPSGFVNQTPVVSGESVGSNIGNALSGLGGQVAGFGLANLLAPKDSSSSLADALKQLLGRTG